MAEKVLEPQTLSFVSGAHNIVRCVVCVCSETWVAPSILGLEGYFEDLSSFLPKVKCFGEVCWVLQQPRLVPPAVERPLTLDCPTPTSIPGYRCAASGQMSTLFPIPQTYTPSRKLFLVPTSCVCLGIGHSTKHQQRNCKVE